MPLNSIGLEKKGRLALVTLNRPLAFNMVNEEMAAELLAVCEDLNGDDQVWVAILTGAGEAFCRGTDPGQAPGRDEGERGLQEQIRLLKAAQSIARVEKPVIAAVNGDALGQGLEMALACDVRIVAQDALLGLTQVEEGLIPWDGGSQRLPRVVGCSRALKMILMSQVVGAQEALSIGLASAVAAKDRVLTEAEEVASAIAKHGPIAARYAKEAVLKGLDVTLEQGLRLEADLNFILQSTQDRAEGIRSFLERRTPEYRGE